MYQVLISKSVVPQGKKKNVTGIFVVTRNVCTCMSLGVVST